MIQNNQGLYPIHIAITGHRDIPNESISLIKQSVRSYLQIALLGAYPNTPIKLLTGLAEGADRLAAEVALELGIKVLAVLPMAKQNYEGDFQTAQSLLEFQTLLSQCESVITMPAEQGLTRDAGYVKQGVFMVENAQVLLALWDGYGLEDKANIAAGGTVDVVRMGLEGTPVHNDDSVLNAKRATMVHHIATPRSRHDDHKNNSIKLLNPSLQASVYAETLQMFEQINRLNTAAVTELSHHDSRTNVGIQQSLDWLLGSALSNAAQHCPLLNAYAVADTLAGARQSKRVGSIKIVTALALLSILFQQIYSGPDMTLTWIALHIGFAVAAFYFFKRFFDGHSQHEAQYLEWRVLAESLRVQIFWKLAGISKPAHTAYFTNRPAEVEWVVQTLINLNTSYCYANDAMPYLAAVQNHWVQNQADYFVGKQNKAAVNAKHALQFNLRVKWAFAFALVLTCATFVAHALGTDNDQLNYLVLASGMSFVIAAVLSSYADQMGFDENAKRYESMGRLFQFAKISLDQAIEKQDSHTADLIVSHLGIQAIQENLSWFQQHRMNAYKVQVA